ncbi:MAG TPA: hypothetical protein VG097_07155 [Gemmata sp.]|nr:hypothetical protein [Gemmata sp.]
MSRDYERDYSEHDHDHDERERDDDDERERKPRRKKSSFGPILLLVGGIGCVVLVVCGGLIALAIWGFSSFATKLAPAMEAAEEFFGELQENQIDRAYLLTSKEYRRRTSSEQFADYIKQFEIFGKHTSRQISSTHIFTNQNGSTVTIKMTLKSPNNAMTCTLTLIEEQGSWKVNTLNVA